MKNIENGEFNTSEQKTKLEQQPPVPNETDQEIAYIELKLQDLEKWARLDRYAAEDKKQIDRLKQILAELNQKKNIQEINNPIIQNKSADAEELQLEDLDEGPMATGHGDMNISEMEMEKIKKDPMYGLDVDEIRKVIDSDPELLSFYRKTKNQMFAESRTELKRVDVLRKMYQILNYPTADVVTRDLARKLNLIFINSESTLEKRANTPINFTNVDPSILKEFVLTDSDLKTYYEKAKKMAGFSFSFKPKIEVFEKMKELLQEEKNSHFGISLLTNFRIFIEKSRK